MIKMQKDPKTTSRRLGRGLQALLSDAESVASPPGNRIESMDASQNSQSHSSNAPESGLRTIKISKLRPNAYQPRGEFEPDALNELAQSISESGLIQPILARKVSDGYEIIAGERRWRAADKAGFKEVPVIVRDASDEQMLELAIVENIHRRDLNAIERAKAYKQYSDVFDLSAEKVAKRLGENRTTVVNYIRLLDLPNEVRQMVISGQLSAGHARSILGIESNRRRAEIAKTAINLGWSVRTLEEVVRREKTEMESPESQSAKEDSKDSHIKELEQRFEDRFKAKVEIHVSNKKANAGRIVLRFFGLTDFERIAELAGVDANLSSEEK